MTQRNELSMQPFFSGLLAKRIFLGAGIGIVLISIFLIGVNHPRPEWGELWMVRPMAVVPIAGAAGCVCYHILDRLSYEGGWKKIVTTILGVIICFIALWMGTVLGLAGTLWH